MRLSMLLSGAALAACLVVPSADAAKRPAGAVKAKTKTVAGITCGKTKSRWVSGKKLPHGWFVSDAVQSSIDTAKARHAKGKTKKRLLALAKSYRLKAAKGAKTCNPSSTGGNTGGNTGGTPGGTFNPITPYTPPVAAVTPLKFSLAGAVGVAQKSSSSRSLRQATTGSNLVAVSTGGQVTDAVSSGSASISKFLIAPNDKLYVIFQSPVNLANTSSYDPSAVKCILAEVDPATGTPTCVDTELTQIFQGVGGGAVVNNPAIQFDATGAIYYAGYTKDNQMVLRKYANGQATNLTAPSAQQIWNFLVLGDGTVFETGRTSASNTYWTRRIAPDGSLHNLLSTQVAYFIEQFPDNNVYFGAGDGNGMGILRWDATHPDADLTWYALNAQTYPLAGTPTIDTSDNAICGGTAGIAHQSFCSFGGAYNTSLLRTSSGKVYAVSNGGGSGAGLLAEYFDKNAGSQTIGFPTTEVKNVSVAQSVGTDLYLSGLDGTGPTAKHVTAMYDTSAASNPETELLPASNEIEVFHLNVVGSNKLMFDGLRYSDNSYIIGQVLLDGSNALSAVTTGKWADFQTFS